MRSLLALIIVAWFAPAIAAEKYDPAALAKQIAPLVEETTFLVIHADVTNLSAAESLRPLEKLLPVEKAEVEKAATLIDLALAAFREAGGRDLFLVGRFNGRMPPLTEALLAVPMASGTDEAAIRGLLPGFASARRGDLLVIALPLGDGRTADPKRLEGIRPMSRPELTDAFRLTGDAPIRVAIVPPPYAARAIVETMPELPASVGGGPSTILTRGFKYAGVGIDPGAMPKLRIAVQSEDAAAAAALHKTIVQALAVLAKEAPSSPQTPELVRLLTPTVDEARLRLEIDGRLIDLLVAMQAKK